ncbi:MAG TPA: PaaI family thioesterase [Candidatus Polarisedimenticolia bacterium]|nr:PaaI family thioesterase [Candidatus Polarisedimenticolia bacterium]
MKNPQSQSTPFSQWLGMRCISRDKGRSEYELTIGPDHLNRRGVAHGGVVASLLDSALGASVVSTLTPEEWTGTLELSVQFRDPVRPGVVTANGRLARRGKSVAFAEGEIRDAAGKILASAHGVWTIWPKKPA